MNFSRILATTAVLVLAGAAQAFAKPATTLRIPETTVFTPPNEAGWFVRSDLNQDIPFQGATGVGLGVGHMHRFFFVDFSFMYYSTSYGAVRLYHPSGAEPGAGTEAARNRLDADRGSVFSLGPGIGFAFKLFDSDRWVEMARFGLNYSQFSDSTRGLTFRGGLANFQAAFGYTLSPFMIAPGITWNLGFFENTSVPGDPNVSHKNYLSLQWWSWHVSLYLWL